MQNERDGELRSGSGELDRETEIGGGRDGERGGMNASSNRDASGIGRSGSESGHGPGTSRSSTSGLGAAGRTDTSTSTGTSGSGLGASGASTTPGSTGSTGAGTGAGLGAAGTSTTPGSASTTSGISDIGSRGIGATGSAGSRSGGFDTPIGDSFESDRSDSAGVRERAAEAKDRAADKLESAISDRKSRTADSLGEVARSLRSAGEQLPDDNGMGRYMLTAASQVDNLASFLDNQDVAELVDDVEDFARRQPAAFLGGAFAIGMLGARFLKSSRRNVHGDPRRDEFRTAGRFDESDTVSRPGAPGYAPRGDTGTTGDLGGYR